MYTDRNYDNMFRPVTQVIIRSVMGHWPRGRRMSIFKELIQSYSIHTYTVKYIHKDMQSYTQTYTVTYTNIHSYIHKTYTVIYTNIHSYIHKHTQLYTVNTDTRVKNRRYPQPGYHPSLSPSPSHPHPHPLPGHQSEPMSHALSIINPLPSTVAVTKPSVTGKWR